MSVAKMKHYNFTHMVHACVMEMDKEKLKTEKKTQIDKAKFGNIWGNSILNEDDTGADVVYGLLV